MKSWVSTDQGTQPKPANNLMEDSAMLAFIFSLTKGGL
jgi:hypothetical protein